MNIISELEASFNDDGEIDASGVTEAKQKQKLWKKYYKNSTYQWVKWVMKLKLLFFLENNLKNQVRILKQLLKMLEQQMNP